MFPVQTVTMTYETIQERIITPVVVKKKRNVLKVNALWDTGSNKTFISDSLAQRMGLHSEGVNTTGTSGGNIQSNLYDISLFLNDLIMFSVRAASYPDSVFDVDVVIGMDIIGQGDLIISNANSHTVFSFRTLSLYTEVFSEENISNESIDSLVELLSERHRST